MIDFFKKLYKTIKEFICSNVVDLFYSKSTQRVLMYSKDICRALKGHSGHSRHSGTRAREALERQSKGTWALKAHKALGHLGTCYSDTRRALGHSGTQALWHLGTRSTRGTLLSRIISESYELFYNFCLKTRKRFI